LNRAFFCNSGTEAIEGALKMARGHGRRISASKFELVALDNSFHGRTFGALSITGQPKYREPFEPLLPGVRFAQRNDVASLEAAVNENTCGIVIEGIQGEGGVLPLSEEFYRAVRRLADRYDALMVHDGIQCSVGRTGRYYSYQAFEPAYARRADAGKAYRLRIASGRRRCERKGGFCHAPECTEPPMAAAPDHSVALEFYSVLEGLLPQIRQVGAYFAEQLRGLQPKFGFIKEVRAEGLMIGIEIDFPCKEFVTDAFEEGLLLNVTHDTVVRLLPPYILTEKEVDRAVRGIAKLFRKAKRRS
jgi:acetylornithine/succinyldiaminopimelate/putrescine aminotransferase